MQQNNSPSWVTRIIWFIFVGWWLSAIFMVIGLVGIASIILSPIGFWFINRVPWAQTLRQRSTHYSYLEENGQMVLTQHAPQQYPWIIRLLYLPIGLVLGLFWLGVAWSISIPIISLPISIWMVDRAPSIITLERF
ncbi:MAG: hypothetical protein M9953_13990 [Thermomicrobiales bacterium]|nr:hypothetical protein [Thermomicrobiales bacterium]MCO5224972.1 hypothetical protein [Thermomicrobiales bacterium]MCO5226445.1 hypothetical protein [Thermomicrobiales bacterium]MCO5227776.1 hypothetical protein [Thermomicrobiales bacterium]